MGAAPAPFPQPALGAHIGAAQWFKWRTRRGEYDSMRHASEGPNARFGERTMMTMAFITPGMAPISATMILLRLSMRLKSRKTRKARKILSIENGLSGGAPRT